MTCSCRTISTDTILELLADARRRAIIRHVEAVGRDTSLDRLFSDTQTGRPNREELLLEAHHHHLPKLDAADVVEYDPDRRRVSPGPELEAATSVLGAISEQRSDIAPRN